jgi:NAD(P)H-flavin reductase
VLFRDELLEIERSLPDFALALALTREPATRRTDFSRRIDARMVADVAARLPESPGCAFVCGSNAFVEIAVDAALALGWKPERSRPNAMALERRSLSFCEGRVGEGNGSHADAVQDDRCRRLEGLLP